MLDSTSLIVTRDRSVVALFRQQLRGQKVAGSRMIVSESVEEACSLLQTVQCRVVVVHLQPQQQGFDEVDKILWVASTLHRQVPVVVLAEGYLVEQATTFYQLGVSDYVSRSDHRDQLGAVLASYLPHAPAGAVGSEKELAGERPAKAAASGRPSAAIPAPTV